MTRRDALIALRDAVKARPYRTGADTKLCMNAFREGAGHCGNAAGNACAAWNGYLESAMTLHEAVLGPVPEMIFSDARRELLRIIDALIAQEPQP